jgi:hypothetical protein
MGLFRIIPQIPQRIRVDLGARSDGTRRIDTDGSRQDAPISRDDAPAYDKLMIEIGEKSVYH